MTNPLDKLVESILLPTNPTIAVVMGFYSLVYGVWLTAPGWTAFGVTSTARATILPELVWGILAAAIGVIIILGTRFIQHDILIRTGLMAGCIYWTIAAVLSLISDWQSTAWITSFALTAYCGLLWLNITVNRHYSKEH